MAGLTTTALVTWRLLLVPETLESPLRRGSSGRLAPSRLSGQIDGRQMETAALKSLSQARQRGLQSFANLLVIGLKLNAGLSILRVYAHFQGAQMGRIEANVSLGATFPTQSTDLTSQLIGPGAMTDRHFHLQLPRRR